MENNLTKDGKVIDDIKQIKTKRHALVTGLKQFSDKDFPTEIGIDSLNDFTIHWKRIKELDPEPQLFIKDGPPFMGEMDHGLTGNHPLVAVLSAIAHHPMLLNYIFPPGQDFNDPSYCGLFYFRFWRMGKWVYVIVDDKIPIVGGKKSDEPPKKKDRSKREFQAVDSSKFTGEPKKEDTAGKLPEQEVGKKVDKNTEEPKESIEPNGVPQPKTIEGEEKLPENKQSAENPEPAKDEVRAENPGPIQPAAASGAKTSTEKPGDESKKNTGVTGGESSKNSLALEVNKKAVGAEQEAPKPSIGTSGAEISNVKPENKTSSNDQSEQKTNDRLEQSKTTEPNELKQSTSKRTSESMWKVSVVSKGSQKDPKNKEVEIDPEKLTKRGSRTIFVRVFGPDGKLFYWATLLEKAYAKAYGGYSQLTKIGVIEILLDFTGGVNEIFYASHLPRGFFLDFKNYSDTRAIILAATNLPMKQEEQAEPKDDSAPPNLFVVTDVILADFRKTLGRDKIVGFVRLSNPYGEVKWMEPWGQTCQEWQVLPELVTAKLNMEARKNGEFYLTYRNFVKAFSTLIVCTIPDGENFNSEGYFGEWIKPRPQYYLCRIDELRFHEFPQHKIWVRDPNDKDTETDVLISLIQNGWCCCSGWPTYNVMQLFLFCMDMNRSHTLPLNFEFFRYNRPIGCSNVGCGKEVVARFKIMPGHYLVVPVIDYSPIVHPCQANDYVLRVITPAKFPKPPLPPISTFTDSENLNIYFHLAETIEEPKNLPPIDSADSIKPETDKTGHKEKGKGKKKRVKH